VKNLLSRSLMSKLVALCVGASLLPTAIIAWMSFESGKEALEEASFASLEAAREGKVREIMSYLLDLKKDLELLGGSVGARQAYAAIDAYYQQTASDADAAFPAKGREYEAVATTIDPFFRKHVDLLDYADLYLICAAHGHVVYSLERGSDLGTNLRTGPFAESGLAHAWKTATKEHRLCVTDIAEYAPAKGAGHFVGAPLRDEEENVVAVVVARIDVADIDGIMDEHSGLGETGQSYILGDDHLMRSDSRLSTEPTALKQKVDTEPARRCVGIHECGTMTSTDYRGIEVLSSYADVKIDEVVGEDFEWYVLAEIPTAEAFEPVHRLAVRTTFVAVLVFLVVAFAGFCVARSITGPVAAVSSQVLQISDGDLTINVPEGLRERLDEIGALGRGVHSMVTSLRGQTVELREASGTLGASAAEISASVAQVTSSATETAAAVTETTTTVEELKQTSEVNSAKAQQVSESARLAAETSESGTAAVEGVMAEMARIKQQMDVVSERVMALSDQTQAISEIIGSVDDLAEQSNLLAVNAAVEAAKAGEHGRGFAVVAQEIRSLAEQSKDATRRVRGILTDIQKATGATVMATEQGAKAVEAGVTRSAEAGEAIEALGDSIDRAAQAAIQIAASSHQQQVGVDQVASAMENIRQATTQNVDSMKQLDQAAVDLRQLGERLVDLLKQYKA